MTDDSKFISNSVITNIFNGYIALNNNIYIMKWNWIAFSHEIKPISDKKLHTFERYYCFCVNVGDGIVIKFEWWRLLDIAVSIKRLFLSITLSPY